MTPPSDISEHQRLYEQLLIASGSTEPNPNIIASELVDRLASICMNCKKPLGDDMKLIVEGKFGLHIYKCFDAMVTKALDKEAVKAGNK